MYFTNVNPKTKGIMKVPMAGADKVQLSVDNLLLFSADSPGDLAVDKEGKKLYWTDTELKKIEYGDLEGKSLRSILKLQGQNELTLFRPIWASIQKKSVTAWYILLCARICHSVIASLAPILLSS